MQQITIDEEFKRLIPPLDEKTYKSLEENILQSGCMYALVLWNGILIDGHNRFEICTKHGIPFDTVEKEFGSREEAIIWIISFQVSRRNLSPRHLSYFRGLHYHAEKAIIKNKDGVNQYSEVRSHNEAKPQAQRTAARLAEKYNVSRATINRDAKAAAAINTIGEASPDAKSKIISGEVSIGKFELERLSALPKEEIEAVAAEIESGTYDRKKTQPQILPEGGDIADSIIDDIVSIKSAISKVSKLFRPELHAQIAEEKKQNLRAALRFCIDILEDMYSWG